MAAEASRSSTSPSMAGASSSNSSGVSVESYIGSFISLTSKSDIRYEGFLFTINPQEASIGLRNVRSFGTEGRRIDGQVPASDKVYEYIVFRGSDIKDLQVKSSPPVQTAPQVHNDPAIIQSQYTAPTASSSLPTVSVPSVPGAGTLSDFNNQLSQPGAPVTTYQNSVPMYPPVGNIPQWNPSPPTTNASGQYPPVGNIPQWNPSPPTTNASDQYPPVGNMPQWNPSPLPTNASGHSTPMYWQGYYGPSGPHQAQQQPLLRPVQGLAVPPPLQPPSTQQMGQYSTMNPSARASNISVSQSMELPPTLFQPVVSSSLPIQSNVLPVQSSTLAADPSSNMMFSKAPAHAASVVSQSSNSPLVSTMLPNVLGKSTVGSLIPNEAKPVSSTSMAFNSLSESLSAAVGKSTSPALVTPGQFLQPGPTISPSDQTEKDVEVAQVSSLLPPPQTPIISAATTAAATVPVSTDTQAPLLPLPSPSNARINGLSSHTRYASSQNRYAHRGGRDRRRGNEFSHPVAKFTEDFDFEAMNEKFKKDEVWGHLGKNKAKSDDGLDLQDEEDVDVPKVDVNPVYKKDDFFDTLSSNALDRENRNGRPRFSEQMKLDTETFGNFPRNRGFRGGRGRGRGPGAGHSRGGGGGGGYYGRGNGYVGRGGRGNSVYRAI